MIFVALCQLVSFLLKYSMKTLPRGAVGLFKDYKTLNQVISDSQIKSKSNGSYSRNNNTYLLLQAKAKICNNI